MPTLGVTSGLSDDFYEDSDAQDRAHPGDLPRSPVALGLMEP